MIMRFRPANIRLINRRSNLPRLLLALSSGNNKSNDKNKPTDPQQLTRSLHIRAYRSSNRRAAPSQVDSRLVICCQSMLHARQQAEARLCTSLQKEGADGGPARKKETKREGQE
ncbi:MAG: hypothetical protein WB974_11040, partial [Acidobacteriaceae bacterium]